MAQKDTHWDQVLAQYIIKHGHVADRFIGMGLLDYDRTEHLRDCGIKRSTIKKVILIEDSGMSNASTFHDGDIITWVGVKSASPRDKAVLDTDGGIECKCSKVRNATLVIEGSFGDLIQRIMGYYPTVGEPITPRD